MLPVVCANLWPTSSIEQSALHKYWDAGPRGIKALDDEHAKVCKDNIFCTKLQTKDMVLDDLSDDDDEDLTNTPETYAQSGKGPLHYGRCHHISC